MTVCLELWKTEQLCILATVASYASSRQYARKQESTMRGRIMSIRVIHGAAADSCSMQERWISTTERFQRKQSFDLHCPLSAGMAKQTDLRGHYFLDTSCKGPLLYHTTTLSKGCRCEILFQGPYKWLLQVHLL